VLPKPSSCLGMAEGDSRRFEPGSGAASRWVGVPCGGKEPRHCSQGLPAPGEGLSGSRAACERGGHTQAVCPQGWLCLGDACAAWQSLRERCVGAWRKSHPCCSCVGKLLAAAGGPALLQSGQSSVLLVSISAPGLVSPVRNKILSPLWFLLRCRCGVCGGAADWELLARGLPSSCGSARSPWQAGGRWEAGS